MSALARLARALDDDVRPQVLGVASGVLFAMALVWTLTCIYLPFGWAAALADPAAHDGEPLVLSLFAVERIDGPDRYLLTKASWHVAVVGPTRDLHVGEDLSIGGTLRADPGAIIEEWRVPAPLRDAKRWLGIAAFAITLALLPAWFRVRGGWIVERA